MKITNMDLRSCRNLVELSVVTIALICLITVYPIAVNVQAQEDGKQKGYTVANPWLGNAIGTEDIVLPGFQPIVKVDSDIQLGQVSFAWAKSYLPAAIRSDKKPYIGAMKLTIQTADEVVELFPEEQEWSHVSPTHVIHIARGSYRGAQIKVSTRIDYDGFAEVGITVTSESGLQVEKVSYETTVSANQFTRVLGFSDKGIRIQKHRNDMLTPPYKGAFLNVIGVADGNRSFWWFADNASGWEIGQQPVTEILRRDGSIVLVQNVIAKPCLIKGERQFKFGFMPSPVKQLGLGFRAARIVGNLTPRQEQALGSRFEVWWPNAFSYDAFPHTDYPGNTISKLSKADRAAYKGLENNRDLIHRYRRIYNLEWIPYFSGHVLSTLDPVMEHYSDAWKIAPPKTFQDGLNPYSSDFDKPVLTHRALGYSDYLLFRLSALIDELDMSGIYLDHGDIHDSLNPKDGNWIDENGVERGSLDIFSFRKFLMRLSTLFHMKGKEGYIFVHMSNREIMPAYMFAYGLINGEQYRGLVEDGSYLDVVSIDEFRTRFSSHQYGLPTYWLPIDWVRYEKDPGWEGSDAQRKTFRRVFGLALLHDVPYWPKGTHKAERFRLRELLANAEIDDANFSGYWSGTVGLFSSNSSIYISEYQSTKGILYVALNDSGKRQPANFSFNEKAPHGCKNIPPIDRGSNAANSSPIIIPPYDFMLLEVYKTKGGCRAVLL